MSIERIERKDGAVVWRVRWRQAGQNRSKVLGRKRDAEAFDAELRRKRRTGELAALDAGKETLAEFGEEWWKLYAEPNLAASTLKVYAILWDTHVLRRLGSLRLREITPSIVTRFRLELEAEGVGRVVDPQGDDPAPGRAPARVRVGPPRIQPGREPCASRRPPGPRRRAAHARRRRGDPRLAARPRAIRDATLVSVLAYAGLRPGEALALTLVARPRSHAARRGGGERRRGRARRRLGRRRTVRLLPPLGADLAEWRLRGRAPSPTTRSCSRATMAARGRRRRTRTGIGGSSARRSRPRASTGARPYDLRHSFVSLLIAEGHNVVEVARQAGHSPKMALDTYAHVFEEFDPTQRVDAAERIRKAREDLRLRSRQPTLFDVA